MHLRFSLSRGLYPRYDARLFARNQPGRWRMKITLLFILFTVLGCILLYLIYRVCNPAQRAARSRANFHFDSVFHDFPIAACIVKLGHRAEEHAVVDSNEALTKLLGWRHDELTGCTMAAWRSWNNPEQLRNFFARIQEKGEVAHFPAEMQGRNRETYYLRLSAKCFVTDGQPHCVICLADMSAQKQAEARIRAESVRYRALYEGMLDGYTRLSRTGHFLECNRAFREALGYTEEELWLMTPRDITPPHLHERDACIEQEVMKHGSCKLYEKEQVRKDGSIFPVELQLYAIHDEQGAFDGWWGIVRDISKRKRDQANLDFLAHHDSLTGLPNRNLLQDRLEHALERARRDEGQLALLFIDLDRFKNVNDTLGHHVGDMLLQAVTRKMSTLLRSSDTLARLGGDEFLILLEEHVNTSSVTVVAERILSLYTNPLSLQDQDIYITASVGVSMFPQDGDNAEVLLKHADLAMFKAKELGRNTYRFFEKDLSVGTFERLAMENGLRSAVNHGELMLQYQPQISLITGQLVGVEALVRWRNPELGLMQPEQFIHIAEDMGIISDIGAWVLREACRQMSIWQKKGLQVPRISVNLSVQQLGRGDLVALVKQQLEAFNLKPQQLELEVTESVLMRQTGQALKVLHNLEALGVYLTVDDFGVGYSSLSYLKRLPVHRLKIDGSFVRDIGQDSNDEAITRAIIALSASLGLEVVAEGVEREEQEVFLRREGCQLVQGFRYDKPLPAHELLGRYHQTTKDRVDTKSA
jgi:diguanylate cyclase (GGDEF)-like protein/PAS domain S-box-containing protein